MARINANVCSITPDGHQTEVVLRVGAEQWLVIKMISPDAALGGIQVGQWVSLDLENTASGIAPIAVDVSSLAIEARANAQLATTGEPCSKVRGDISRNHDAGAEPQASV